MLRKTDLFMYVLLGVLLFKLRCPALVRGVDVGVNGEYRKVGGSYTVFFVGKLFASPCMLRDAKFQPGVVFIALRTTGSVGLPYQSAHTPLLDIATLSTSTVVSLTFRFCFGASALSVSLPFNRFVTMNDRLRPCRKYFSDVNIIRHVSVRTDLRSVASLGDSQNVAVYYSLGTTREHFWRGKTTIGDESSLFIIR